MNDSISQKMRAYYTKYYRDECCLPDWEKRVEHRLHEEDDEVIKMNKLQLLLRSTFAGQKHCIVGAGTGGLAITLTERFGCEVYGVEPSDEEMTIIQERNALAGIPAEHFKKEFGERMSFPDNTFDVVHCYTVLEHVQNVDGCLSEMIRVTKPGGFIYISTPNYAYPYEGHYKIIFPTFLPKFFGSLYLRLLGKSPAFFRSVNLLTERYVNRLLLPKKGIHWFRVYHPYPRVSGKLAGLLNYLIFNRFVYPKQEIIITKTAIWNDEQ